MTELRSAVKLRRALSLLLLSLFSLAAFSAGHAAPPAVKQRYLALVGTYTAKTESKGIYAYEFIAGSGRLAAHGVAAETPDPSFVVIHPNGKFVYAVNEAGKNSTVTAFSLDAKNYKLTLLNQLPALGEDPCYLSFDKTGKFLFVANYSSGNVAVFPIQANGHLGEHTALAQHKGSGPNKERQEAPHAHWIEPSPDNRFVFVADLGLDQILGYRFDATKGTLTPSDPPFSKLASAAGPRHATFSANGHFFYVTSELNSTVTSFSYDAEKGTFHQIQVISTLPSDYKGRNDTAEILAHPNGKWLYVSNRGRDTIAVFSIDPAKGTLTFSGDFSTGGKEPRHFVIDPTGHYILAENQNSGSIVTFRIDSVSGRFTPAGAVAFVPSPVCLAFDLAD